MWLHWFDVPAQLVDPMPPCPALAGLEPVLRTDVRPEHARYASSIICEIAAGIEEPYALDWRFFSASRVGLHV